METLKPAETYISSFYTSLAKESRMASHHAEGMGRVWFALCLAGQREICDGEQYRPPYFALLVAKYWVTLVLYAAH